MPVLVELVHLALHAGVLLAGGGELGGGRGHGVRVGVFAAAVACRRRRPCRSVLLLVLFLLLLILRMLLVVRRMRCEDEAGESGAVVYIAVLALWWI